MAQHVAMGVYLLNVILVFRILLKTEMVKILISFSPSEHFSSSQVPPYMLALLSIGATRVIISSSFSINIIVIMIIFMVQIFVSTKIMTIL